jgi:hypothetical protein
MKKYKLHKILIGSGQTCENLGFPALPSIVNTDRNITNRIIAIGDIHGDLDLAINCLTIAKVIQQVFFYKNKKTNKIEETDNNTTEHIQESECPDDIVILNYKEESKPRYYKWIGKNTIVVQVGDQVDRCRPVDKECHDPNETVNDEASDIKILFFFHDLHLIAIKSCGCAVYSLLGNHELLNVIGNLRYVSYKGLEEFKKDDSDDIFVGRKNAFNINSDNKLYKKKSNLANFLACARVSAIIVDNYLFVHAGVLEKLIKYTAKKANKNKIKSIEVINETIRQWLLNADSIEDKDYIGKLLIGKTLSPFWPRIFGNLPSGLDRTNQLCKHHVEPVLRHLNLKGLIVGHTPQLKIGINSTCTDTVWRVDVASSQAFEKIMKDDITDQKEEEVISGRKPQVLEIILGSDNSLDKFNIIKMK